MSETITFEQVGDVLALAAARDQRTVGDGDVLAWYDDLNTARVTYADVRAALARFYVEQAALQPDLRFRITSPDAIRLVRKIREERLTNFTYEPPAGDTDPHYLTRLRAQQHAVASGDIPNTTHAPAIEGGPHTTVVQQLAAVGRTLPNADDEEPTTKVRRPGPLGRECPKCSAAIGRPCRTPAGKERAAHPARRGESTDPTVEAAEIERRREASRRALARRTEAS
jgi:hypothetical protein